MDPERLNDWQVLFEKALRVLDGAASVIGPFEWSFGGGTAQEVDSGFERVRILELRAVGAAGLRA